MTQAFGNHDKLTATEATATRGAGTSEAEVPGAPGAGKSMTFALHVYAAAKAAVITRDADLLAKGEVLRLSADVNAAILEGLGTG